jgi:copper chaperone CopZ
LTFQQLESLRRRRLDRGDEMAQQSFQVQEIHCGACEAAIRKSLSRMDGVRIVQPDAATNRVEVVYDDDAATGPGAIAERLATAVYPVVG